MVEFFKVTTLTPKGDSKEYMYMGEIKTPEDSMKLSKFMVECCDDTSDFFPCPDDWDPIKWRDSTMAKWEAIGSERTVLPLPSPFPFSFI